MILFVVLAFIVVFTFVLLGILFFIVGKDGQAKKDAVVPITDLNQIDEELLEKSLEQEQPHLIKMGVDAVSLEETLCLKRSKELEDQLLAISQKADGQSDEAKAMIKALTQENEALKSQQAHVQEVTAQLTALQEEASLLHLNNLALQGNLETAQGRVRFLEEEIAGVRVQMGEEINRAQATIAVLKQENETLGLTSKQPVSEDMSALERKYEDLESAYQELQYTLIKSRAQSSGLEKVNLNYKNQLEEALKNIDDLRADTSSREVV